MAQPILSFSLLLCILYFAGTTASAAVGKSSTSLGYIKTSCSSTRYPSVCLQSLSVYANKIQRNPQQLAQAALTVSLNKARSTAAYVSKMTRVKGLKGRQYQAVRDCVDNMGDSVDRLSRSMKEISQTGRSTGQSDFSWHMSNVQTWVSAALTDENTCSDGFAGHGMDGNVKTAIRARVVNVAQVTSNALALINKYASRHRA
ncbi:21 kDa protein-like [Macadamia integrifolia]|uniref:21 kDa protein-like n=1 Tax=Macadamia integrifolia TaxID=60698 RepID=UPI001C4E9CFF|nr:21 kDa protein-like [Macadamia integrifolia]